MRLLTRLKENGAIRFAIAPCHLHRATHHQETHMGEIIKLTSSPDHKPRVKGVHKDSSLTCIKTSAPDVFVKVIISNKEEQELYLGDDIAVPKGANLSIRLFRKNRGDNPYSAELDLSPVAG
jgi:hypothetical protein